MVDTDSQYSHQLILNQHYVVLGFSCLSLFSLPDQPPPGKKAKALFPFEGQKEKELSFQKGAIIDLLHTFNENWLEGMVRQTKGIFPSSYVHKIHNYYKNH